MSNNYFQFKQFTVQHDQCAMKVGTDAVLLGAWADALHAKSILDMGTGSGIIALMLAQRTLASICGIEINKDAYLQAKENSAKSPWNKRIIIVHNTVQDFADHNDLKFDLIVSNPPYFRNSLKSPEQQRTTARHDNELSYEELLIGAAKLLNKNGIVSLIIPAESLSEITRIALQSNLFCKRKLYVSTKPNQQPKRVLIEFITSPEPVVEESLCIQNNDKEYSKEYRELTKDFYLNF